MILKKCDFYVFSDSRRSYHRCKKGGVWQKPENVLLNCTPNGQKISYINLRFYCQNIQQSISKKNQSDWKQQQYQWKIARQLVRQFARQIARQRQLSSKMIRVYQVQSENSKNCHQTNQSTLEEASSYIFVTNPYQDYFPIKINSICKSYFYSKDQSLVTSGQRADSNIKSFISRYRLFSGKLHQSRHQLVQIRSSVKVSVKSVHQGRSFLLHRKHNM